VSIGKVGHSQQAQRNETIASGKRDEAIASLRAVKSALGAGANLEEFKKYEIESRVKVDALPDAPDNREAKAISDLFADAVTFSVIQITGGEFDASALDSAKDRYRDDPDILKALNEIKSEDIVRRIDGEDNAVQAGLPPKGKRTEHDRQFLLEIAGIEQRTAHKLNAESARYISGLLIARAEKRLLELK
jgi:hypothetical protein